MLSQGVLNFTSDGLGHGCTFFFELPLYSEAAASTFLNDNSIVEPTAIMRTDNSIGVKRTSFSRLLTREGIPNTHIKCEGTHSKHQVPLCILRESSAWSPPLHLISVRLHRIIYSILRIHRQLKCPLLPF